MIGNKEVEHIAELAHLKLKEDEVNIFTDQLSSILDYIDKLKELKTDNVVPTAYTVPMKNIFREDKAEPSLDREKALANAPQKKEGQFKVPPIMND